MPRPPSSHTRDDTAYLLPMAAFLAGVWLDSIFPSHGPILYVTRTAFAAVLLLLFRKHFTKISWSYWWIGLLAGVVGIVQWVGMEHLLLHLWPTYPHPAGANLDPFHDIPNPAWRFTYIAFRIAGPVLVVPFMEELFWRDWLWRTIQSPYDFKLPRIGEWDWKAFLIVTALFASVHTQWITAAEWGIMIAIVLCLTRSLGACIIMHAVTNLLLALYVLHTHDWSFW